MTQVSAFQTFDMPKALNLSGLGQISDAFDFLDNVDFALLGKVYQDVAAYQFTTDTTHLAAFGGTNFSFTNSVPVSGTVTGVALTEGSLADGLGGQTLQTMISGFSISAVEIANAVTSLSTTDDAVVLGKIFAGADRFDLSEGNDVASGFAGNDKMFGNGGNDKLLGDDGNDVLSGGKGDDRLFGGAGNDVLDGGPGADFLHGGAGNDIVSYATATAGQTIDMALITAQTNGDTFVSIEGLIGSNFADTFTATRVATSLFGMGGADKLVGGTRNDIISGGLGKDTLTGGAGIDTFRFDVAPTAANADLITDFLRATDKIGLSSTVFKGLTLLGAHGLDPSNFIRSATATATSALDANDHLIYNTTTGMLFYDADGAGGKAGVAIAQLGDTHHVVLAATDFLII